MLSLGYAYPTLKMTEMYNSPSSPYWALKFFLPLALPADHPFWTAPERAPDRSRETVVQEAPGMVLQPDGRQVVALTGGTPHRTPDKYNKFAYSTRFGTNVVDGVGRAGAAPDGTLLLSGDGDRFRARRRIAESGTDRGAVYSRWEPWNDVTVETWLAPAPTWYVRLHRLDAGRELTSGEGGFPVPAAEGHATGAEGATAVAAAQTGESLVKGLDGDRDGEVLSLNPNTNLLHPRTVAPTLAGVHDPGTEWFATAVLGRRPGLVAGRANESSDAADGSAVSSATAHAPTPVGRDEDAGPVSTDVEGPAYRRDGDVHVLETADGATLLRVDSGSLVEGPADGGE